MKKLLIILSVFILMGYSEDEHSKIKFEVAAWMDFPPDAISFKDIFVGKYIACGYVNAKDGDGLDVGFSPFFHNISRHIILFDNKYNTESTTSENFANLWQVCLNEKFETKKKSSD